MGASTTQHFIVGIIEEIAVFTISVRYPTTTNQSTRIRITIIKDAACKLCGSSVAQTLGRYRWRYEKIERALSDVVKKGQEIGTAV